MKDTYLDNKIKNTCNGCGACRLVCPVNAIEMKEDSEGFLYPEIDESKCIKCNKCRRICSNYPKRNEYDIKAYATKNKNENERRDSTSGGMFKILAEYVIEKQGVVFGVRFDNDLNVIHDYAEDLEKCREFSFSKYVRSNLKDSYEKVKELLKNDRFVLFTGTPCQIQGLRNFLEKDNEKLILCEIICHANPSPKVLKMYIKNNEFNSGKKVKKVYFRSKNPEMNNGAYVEFEDGSKIKDTVYIKSFSGEQLINRPSCNNCQFVDENRKADFTIGDFWGIERIFPEFNDKEGISLLTVNTEKASKIFNEVKDKMEFKEVDLKLAFKYNHHSNLQQSKNRDKFFKEVSDGTINEENIIAYMNKYTKKPLYRKILEKGKAIVVNKILKK